MGTLKKCIYLVEDNDDIREMLLYLLREDYDVHACPSVRSFNETMKKGKPDMVILDVMLGDGNGIDVCDVLKGNKKTNHIPVLMMSANTEFKSLKANAVQKILSVSRLI